MKLLSEIDIDSVLPLIGLPLIGLLQFYFNSLPDILTNLISSCAYLPLSLNDDWSDLKFKHWDLTVDGDEFH